MRLTETSQSTPIRVLLVDDHPIVRAGLADTIAGQPDMTVVGELEDGTHVLPSFAALRPDVTILDIAMPGLDGIQTLEALRRQHGHARVIMLTTLAGDHQMRRAVELGAAGFLMKSSVRKDLLDAIRAVHAGTRWIPPDVARTLVEHLGQPQLSEREVAVLRSAAGGNANKQIGVQLGIAEDTVKTHIRTILAKLGARDRTHAVAIAVKRGIISL
ncbi:LuxR family two component transcriptional regulator [Pseudoduganella flava]|uniref:LuxR family two component transcriptional regulator n=1 Tax=Pseudoduganella flava TaxID=871742 RepID=A0A562Q0K6_9BURK|nr:response regulator transcription factor [Pseudoduganella flava]QGZ38245.1 response regulator [Pseudoduganella flava]TWI50222.1 LuxR family two component transcriptional regulator [Pseudoduganella flava]